MTQLQERLIEERERLGWSIRGAAREADINPQTMRHLEGHTESPTPVEAFRLEVALKLADVYWPHLLLTDFLPDTPFELVRR